MTKKNNVSVIVTFKPNELSKIDEIKEKYGVNRQTAIRMLINSLFNVSTEPIVRGPEPERKPGNRNV